MPLFSPYVHGIPQSVFFLVSCLVEPHERPMSTAKEILWRDRYLKNVKFDDRTRSSPLLN